MCSITNVEKYTCIYEEIFYFILIRALIVTVIIVGNWIGDRVQLLDEAVISFRDNVLETGMNLSVLLSSPAMGKW